MEISFNDRLARWVARKVLSDYVFFCHGWWENSIERHVISPSGRGGLHSTYVRLVAAGGQPCRGAVASTIFVMPMLAMLVRVSGSLVTTFCCLKDISVF
jgi:hypothetical protein